MRMQVLYADTPQWAAVAARAEELMSAGGFRPLKETPRVTAGFLSDAAVGEAFVKRVMTRSWTAGMFQRVRGSRATRALRGAALLRAAGFSCPRPLLAMERRQFGAVRASYLFCEALRGAETMSAVALRGGRPNFVHRRRVLAAVAREVRRLHDAGLFTCDMQETNLMLEEGDGGLGIYFVDLEDFCRPLRLSRRHRLLNLVHLDRSIGRFLRPAQRLRFLYVYLGGHPPRREARRIVGRLLRIRQRLDRGAQGRPAPTGVPSRRPSASSADASGAESA